MQLSIVCLVLVGVVAMQVASNPCGHISLDEGWHELESGCGSGHLSLGHGGLSHTGLENCGCSSCAAPTWSTCSGNAGCGCGSCDKTIIVQPTGCKYVVPASPVIVQPHLVHNPSCVNVSPQILATTNPSSVSVQPIVVKVIKEIQQTCCAESPCLSAGCSTCGGGSWHH